MNVLLTSAGRRSYLVNYFQEALAGSGKVIAANMYSDAAGMFAADIAIVTPPSHSDEYVPAVLDICRRYDVTLLCSLHDLDVFILSQHLSAFQSMGVIAILPSAEWGHLALDKYECTRVLQRNGIAVPFSTLSLQHALDATAAGEVAFPMIVKARLGFGSLGLEICRDQHELTRAYHHTRTSCQESPAQQFIETPEDDLVLIQQFIEGSEYCVAVVNDLDGQYCTHFVCKVMSMRAGESDLAVSWTSSLGDGIARDLSHLTRHRGIWGVDCIEDAGTLRVIDVNPRFTGDYPFHHMAGADIPKALIEWASGRQPDTNCLQTEAGVRGYKDLVPTKLPAGFRPSNC